MKKSEIDLSQCLPLNANCEKCNVELEKIYIPLRELPKIVRAVWDDLRFNYQILKCPKCGYCGIHTE